MHILGNNIISDSLHNAVLNGQITASAAYLYLVLYRHARNKEDKSVRISRTFLAREIGLACGESVDRSIRSLVDARFISVDNCRTRASQAGNKYTIL